MLMILYCQDVKDESFSVVNEALDEKISSELGLLWLASLSARWENFSEPFRKVRAACFSPGSPSTSSHGNWGICGDLLFDNADIVGAGSQEPQRESVKRSRVQRVFRAKGRWAGSAGVLV